MSSEEKWKPGHFIKKALNKSEDSPPQTTSMNTETPKSDAIAPQQTAPPAAPACEESSDLLPRDSSLASMPFFATESEPFYLNIVVVDSSQAVEQQVGAKLGKGFWSNQASKLAKQVVNESKIAAKVATQLSEKIPAAVKSMGITLEVTPKFKLGSFVVLKARLIEVTPFEIVKFAKGDAYGESFAAMLDAFETLELHDAIQTVSVKVQEKINSALIEKLADVLPEKLQEQGILITAIAKSSKDQAEFFFDFVRGLQTGETSV